MVEIRSEIEDLNSKIKFKYLINHTDSLVFKIEILI